MSDLDEAGLSRWMADVLPDLGGIRRITKFSGGQSNPTYQVDTEAGDFVLRRKPFGALLPSAHAVEREYRLIAALHPTGFPVARPVALCEDEAVIGVPFYLMTFVTGRTCWDGTLPDVPRERRRAHYDAAVDTLAALHAIDPAAVGLADFGAPGNYVARQVQRWTRQYRAAQTDEITEVERLIDWLPRSVPAQARVSIIHGDYRIDNLIYADDGPDIRAVLDWELATIGDPLADFAYFAMSWAMPQDGRSGLGGVDLEQAGLPRLDDVVARYCSATGRAEMPDLHWYFSYNMFRLVGIIQGIKKRLADGNASSARAADAVAKLEPLARAAWAEAERAGAAA